MQPHRQKSSGRGLIITFIVIGIVAAGGIALRVHNAHALKRDTENDAVASVAVVQPAKSSDQEEVVLPGNIEAWHEATIYARTNGYVKRWLTPMGTKVHKDELLAEIETPEVDAQLRQTEADVKTAEANYKLAQLTAERWKHLLKTDSVSKQEADEKIGDAEAKGAILASMRASRDHLRELSGFKNVVAPFDGMITSRTLDIGMLVSAGIDTQQALFHIVQADRLRIYVKVPQNYSSKITPDMVAELHFTEHPGEVFKAKFLKSADALEPMSRTLLIEFVLDNSEGKVFSGGYTEVHIKFPSADNSLRLPVNTLIFRSDGLQVATIDDKNHAVIKKVTMGRDFGNQVEIAAGITANERVIVNPPDSLQDGQEVRVIEPSDKDKKDGKDKKDDKKL